MAKPDNAERNSLKYGEFARDGYEPALAKWRKDWAIAPTRAPRVNPNVRFEARVEGQLNGNDGWKTDIALLLSRVHFAVQEVHSWLDSYARA